MVCYLYMGLFDLFNKKEISKESLQLLELRKFLDELLLTENYIARSDYNNVLDDYKDTIEYFNVLNNSNMLKKYCKQNSLSMKDVIYTLNQYKDILIVVEKHNEEYIQSAMKTDKEYLDNVLKTVDPIIILDDDQRRVVLTDEDYCLVIAGAGAGKTTTVAAKVKYLVDKKGIDPSQILVISFTNKAVQELKERIQRDLKIDCPIATFHSTGNAILHKKNPDRLNIVDDSVLYKVIENYFKNIILQNESSVKNLILFFASYFDAPVDDQVDLETFFNKLAKSNFSTMKSDFEEYKTNIIDKRTKKNITIQNEILRSNQEVEIANFLYLNNIDYEYEPLYPYHIEYSRKPYTPDFVIKQNGKEAYIEHFGITQSGKNNRYTERELAKYKNAVNEKILLHRNHDTKLIYTFSEYNDSRNLRIHLKEELENAGFVCKPRTSKEIMEKIISTEENRYIRRLISLLCRFISNFKTNGYTSDEFDAMKHSTTNVRSKLFLNICHECYLEYQKYLKENNAVDFQDMINDSARILKETKEMNKILDFKYIIVDEYQDISRQRFDLTTALSKVTNAKIIAVGDDWQSIYAFSGSDITLFTKFEEKMGYAKLLKIVKTYRNAQEVIDIAGNFIQRNEAQIKKELKSPKNIKDPVIIYTYDNSKKKRNVSYKEGPNYQMAKAVETALQHIIENNEDKKKVLLLGRYGFDGDQLEKSGLFEYERYGNKINSIKYPNLDIRFMTAHASKGLGFDNVIIINAKNETFGFPSKIEDDPVLSFVIKGDHSIDYAEERRLFYVAMTRTKNRVYFIAPEQNPSEFLLEIKKDYKNVSLVGKWEENTTIKKNYNKCPLCGYPLQFKYKNAYGLRLYICTNEPELCGFMTNEYSAGKLSICKCDKCVDGYLIAKSVESGYFLGCTNYLKNGKGCNNTQSWKDYYNDKGYTDVLEAPKIIKKENIDTKRIETKKELFKVEKKTYKIVEINQSKMKAVFYKDKDLNEVCNTILNCILHVSEIRYLGIYSIATILKDKHDQQFVKYNLPVIPEYGYYENSLLTKNDLMDIIKWLIEEKYLLLTKGKYPVLHITNKGLNYNNEMTYRKLLNFKNKYLNGGRL